MVAIDALYIFDEHNNAILEHVYAGRPPSAPVLLAAYLSAAPQPHQPHHAPPSTFYAAQAVPPTFVTAAVQDRLLFLTASSADVEPLVALEWLHRVADALTEFLGAPLLASKLVSSYDVVAQIVGEMCDAGTISTTELNALQEIVETPSWVGNLFGGFGLPSAPPSLGPGSLQRPAAPFATGSSGGSAAAAGSAIPWRRSNVRHTSNELYVDVVEELSVIFAPSGRPLSAIAHGNLLFTAQLSGVPDLLLSLSAPGGPQGILAAMDLPVFHPCVRLARWRDKPGTLSFVPPDGKFVLAGYECNLLPGLFGGQALAGQPQLDLPVWIETLAGQGAHGDEYEVRLKTKQAGGLAKDGLSSGTIPSSAAAGSLGRNLSGARQPAGQQPLENVVVTVPLPARAKSVDSLKASKGEAHFLASEALVEWKLLPREMASLGKAGAVLRFAVQAEPGSRADDAPPVGPPNGLTADTIDYDEGQGQPAPAASRQTSYDRDTAPKRRPTVMPAAATLSFMAKGWLASGLRVESLTVNAAASRGLGAGVAPYKGVRYVTVSRGGVEVRS